MRFARVSSFAALVLICSLSSHAQNKINPASQIYWPTCAAGQSYAPMTNTCIAPSAVVAAAARASAAAAQSSATAALPANGVTTTPGGGLRASTDAAGASVTSLSPVIDVMAAPYSAKCDGTTDDTSSFAGALSAASAGSVILLPNSVTCVVDNILMKSGVYLRSENATLLHKTGSSLDLLDFNGITNSGILGTITLDGNRANVSAMVDNLKIYFGATNLYFQDVMSKNAAEDDFYIGGTGAVSSGIVVDNLIGTNATRNGLSITNASDVHFKHASLSGSNGSSPQAGVDIETNVFADTISNVVFDVLEASSDALNGLQIYGKI
jgi:hypothetical protein